MNLTQREAALRLADNMDLSLEAWMDQAATMLRELAAEPQGEPDDEYRCGGPRCDGNCCQPVQEPVQEPVAWEYWNPSDTTFSGQDTFLKKAVSYFTDDTRRGYAAQGYMFRPLFYARPPQRPPLTDGQIKRCVDEAHGRGLNVVDQLSEFTIKFARAVERAHGIGEAP